MEEKTDRELLLEHVTSLNPEAFELLVRRHLPVVRNACRRILGASWAQQEADDVAQAVFFVLHQKAELLVGRTALGGIQRKLGLADSGGSLARWLYDAACKAAMHVRRNAARKTWKDAEAQKRYARERRSEDEAKEVKTVSGEAEQAALRAQLDAAMANLPAAQREALILHYFQGKTRSEMAAVLGCPEGTAARRVNAGLEKLRKQLRRRGVGISAAFLVSCLEAERTSGLLAVGSAASMAAALGDAAEFGVQQQVKTIAHDIASGKTPEHVERLAKELLKDMNAIPNPSFLLTAGSAAAVFVISGLTAFGLFDGFSLFRQVEQTASAPTAKITAADACGRSVIKTATTALDQNNSDGSATPAAKGFHAEKPPEGGRPGPIGQGSLRAINDHGAVMDCPLKHTSVCVRVDGFIASVELTQRFHNPTKERIEAVYIFPLPENSAVDRMVMQIGKRQIVGEVHLRREARMIYEQARAQGRKTALLEQERPNLFTQNVANIGPGEEVSVTLRYNQKLKYDKGVYRFTYPMTIGPRYMGPQAPAEAVVKETADSSVVNLAKESSTANIGGTPDAERVSPSFITAKDRNGHDISLIVELNAGVALNRVECRSHVVTATNNGAAGRLVKLSSADSIPNKDFLLEYEVAGEKPEIGTATYWTESLGGGYFLLMVQPKKAPTPEELMPKEMVFIVDTSGSMGQWGGGDNKQQWKMECAKEAMRQCVRGVNPRDTFQFYSFNTGATAVFDKPVPATQENLDKALKYIDTLRAAGGTNMVGPLDAALSIPESPTHLRMICIMGDGDIGSENVFLDRINNNLGNARLFSFGVGAAPNHYVIERAAEIGRGAAFYIRPEDPVNEAVGRFYECVRNPYLTHIQLDWEGVEVSDIVPTYIPDLYAGQPLMILGRYKEPKAGKLTLKGKLAGQDYSQTVEVDFTDSITGNPALPSVWAREKIKLLERSNLQSRNPQAVGSIIDLALTYGLMSQYTSLVAVDEEVDQNFDGTMPKTARVPLYLPAWTDEGYAAPHEPITKDKARYVVERGDFDEDIWESKTAENRSVYRGSGAQQAEKLLNTLEGKGDGKAGGRETSNNAAVLPDAIFGAANAPRGLRRQLEPSKPSSPPASSTAELALKDKRGNIPRRYFSRQSGEYEEQEKRNGIEKEKYAYAEGGIVSSNEFDSLKKELEGLRAKMASGEVAASPSASVDRALTPAPGRLGPSDKNGRVSGFREAGGGGMNRAKSPVLNAPAGEVKDYAEYEYDGDERKRGPETNKLQATAKALSENDGKLTKDIKTAFARDEKTGEFSNAEAVNTQIAELLSDRENEGRSIIGLQLAAETAEAPKGKQLITEDNLTAARSLILSGKTPDVRIRALMAVWALRGKDDLKFYKTALSDQDAVVRMTAFRLCLSALSEEMENLKGTPDKDEMKAEKTEAELEKMLKAALKDEAEGIRYAATNWVAALGPQKTMKLLSEALAKENDAGIRNAVAEKMVRGALRGREALPKDKVIEELTRALRKDDDLFVVAMRGLAALDALGPVADCLAEKILNGNPEKEQYAMLSAAGVLCEISQAHTAARTRSDKPTEAQKQTDAAMEKVAKLLTAVAARDDRNVKLVREPQHTVDSALKITALNVLRGGMSAQLIEACASCVKPGNDPVLRRTAALVAAEAGPAGAELAVGALEDPEFRNDPKLLAQFFLTVRGTKHAERAAEIAKKWLAEPWVRPSDRQAESDFAFLRAALLEAVVEKAVSAGGASETELGLILDSLSKDAFWRVRRSALCGIARLKDRTALSKVTTAASDVHPVVAELAMATLVAFTADKDQTRDAYLKQLSRGPETGLYREIFSAEKLNFDRLLADRAEMRRVLESRMKAVAVN
jgi:Ca-activated chloride channel family protein